MDSSYENVIEWVNGDTKAVVTASARKFRNRIKKLAEKFPNDVKIVHENADGSIVASVPLSYIVFRKPKEMSDEQKEVLSKRMKKMRQSQS